MVMARWKNEWVLWRKPGRRGFSTVASPPPATVARSRLRTRRPHRARYACNTRELCPVPRMMPSYSAPIVVAPLASARTSASLGPRLRTASHLLSPIDGLHFIVSPVTVGNVLEPVFVFEDGKASPVCSLPVFRAPGQPLGPDF